MEMVMLGFFLETDVEHSKQLGLPSNDLLFISEKMRIGKQENLVCNLNDKKNIVEDIQITQQDLIDGLKLKIVHKIVKFIQKDWLKPCADQIASFKKMKRMDLKKFLQAHE